MILVFPIFGVFFYILSSIEVSKKQFRKKIKFYEDKASKYIDRDNLINLSKIDNDSKEHITKIRYLQEFASFPLYDNTSTKYLTPGEKKFECLLEELKKAKRYIFLEYFIIEEGKMWNSILEILKQKVKEGVKVRVLYDDVGCFFKLPKNYYKKIEKEGIECRVFNPFNPLLTAKQNNRDHRKIVSIDGEVAFTGGINLADEYINEKQPYGHWKDSSIMIKGNAAWSFTLMFLQMWELCGNDNEDYSIYHPNSSYKTDINEKGYVQPYCDSPMDKENVGEHIYLHIINNAKKYVYINTPYLIIDNSMVSALCLAAKSGIDVRIVTPHKWDKKIVHIATRSYYRELINAGVKIYEYSKGFIHSKTFVSDDTIATVGTTNLDFRSLYLHFECGVCIYNNKTVMDVKEDFLETLNSCEIITKEKCKCGLLRGMFQEVLRLFAPFM